MSEATFHFSGLGSAARARRGLAADSQPAHEVRMHEASPEAELDELPKLDSYTALDSEQKQIRLLRFISNGHDKLSCSMSTASLSDLTVEYSALSYRWGAPPVTRDGFRSLMIAGELVSVRPSLYSFLQSLASLHFGLIFWLDVLCINQHDNNERASQVSIMKDIFAQATRVYVWLGEVDTDAEYAFTQTQAVQEGRHVSQPHEFLESVVCLFCRPYWTRMWIIQEFTVANSIDLVCGNLEVAWIDLIGAVEMYHASSGDDPGWQTYQKFKQLRIDYTQQKIPLLDLMRDYRSSRCSDSRDMVYALCGLASDGDAIRIDYNQNAMFLVFQFLEHTVQSGEQVHLFEGKKETQKNPRISDSSRRQSSVQSMEANRSLAVLSQLKHSLRVSKEEFITCLRDRYSSTSFISNAQVYGHVIGSGWVSFSQQDLDRPNVSHRLQSVCFRVSTTPRKADKLPEVVFFRGNQATQGGVVVLLHDCYLLFTTESEQPQVLIGPDDNRTGTMLGRNTSSFSFEDIHYLSQLVQRCVRKCVWPGQGGLQNASDARHPFHASQIHHLPIHINPVLFFCLIFCTHEPWLSWTLLHHCFEDPENGEVLPQCSCSHTLDLDRKDRDPSSITRFSSDQFALGSKAHVQEDQKEYFASIRFSVQRRNEYYHTMQVAWVKDNSLMLFPEWYEQLHGEAWMRKNAQKPPTFKTGDRWFVTDETLSCQQPRATFGDGNVTPLTEHSQLRLELISSSHLGGLWLALHPKSKLAGDAHALNLDAIIANVNGSFSWVEAVFDLGLLEEMIGRRSARTVVAAPLPLDNFLESRQVRDESDSMVVNTLLYVKRGGFSASACKICLNESGTVLSGELLCDDGTYVHAELPLLDRIVLSDNRLRYTFKCSGMKITHAPFDQLQQPHNQRSPGMYIL